MKEIDWENAPEGSTHWEPRYANTPESWMKFVGGLWFWFSDGRDVWFPADPVCQERIYAMIEKPHQPWSGDGLPPVCTECDVTPHNTIWGFSVVDTCRCTVIAYHEDFVWLDIGTHGVPVATRIDKVDFRPIKTQAKIEAEAREAAIEEMWKIYWQPSAPSAKQALGLLWDAGLRLPKGGDA